MSKLKKVELNLQFNKAIQSIEDTSKHIFLTGKAGTGKSTLLKYFRKHTNKNYVVLAPTGVAAVNVSGETIHSFFHFTPGITAEEAAKKGKQYKKDKLYTEVEIIIIDEISMVRADLLDCVNIFLQNARESYHSFGGVQIVMIGDLFQLPPVVTRDEIQAFSQRYNSPHFFSSDVIGSILTQEPESFIFIELQKIYRQSDKNFIELLNVIRNNTAKAEHMNMLHQQLKPEIRPIDFPQHIVLTTTNAQAEDLNETNMINLNTKAHLFEGVIKGQFDKNMLPTPEILKLKEGARVMFLNNDPTGRWINGTLGTILGFENEEDEAGNITKLITVEIDDGPIVSVDTFTWTNYKTTYNQDEKKLQTESIGSYTQIPLKSAWAVTIHKSQGKTFQNLIIDIGNGAFASGQVYVALSRATSLDGIILTKPIRPNHIIVDRKVQMFMKHLYNTYNSENSH